MNNLMEKPQENAKEWIQTDDNQWVRKEDNRQYTVIDAYEGPVINANQKIIGTAYFVKMVEVDLNKFTSEQLEEEVSAYYYDGLAEIKETYKTDWEQIVAECIAENEPHDYDSAYLKNRKKLISHINRLYGVKRTY